MLPDLLRKSSLFRLLHDIEVDLAEEVRARGCPHCDGTLHYARYERDPRGGPEDLPDELCVRHSLCCDTCRKRTLPPSVLFFGRRVYWGAIVVLVCALRQQRDGSASYRKLQKLFGVHRSTVWRWMEYFRECFLQTSQWLRLKDRLRADVDTDEAPGCVLELVVGKHGRFSEAVQALMVLVCAPHFASCVMDT